jgi:hypothetical protein
MKIFALIALILIVLFESRAADLRGKIELLDANGDPAGPGEGLVIRIIQSGNSDRTVAGGLFRIQLTEGQKPGTQFEMQVEHAEYRIYEPVGGREGCRRTYKTRSSLSNCCQRVRGHFFRRLESNSLSRKRLKKPAILKHSRQEITPRQSPTLTAI